MPKNKIKASRTKKPAEAAASTAVEGLNLMIDLYSAHSIAHSILKAEEATSEISDEIQGLLAVAVGTENRTIAENNLKIILQYYQDSPELLNEHFALDPDRPKEERTYGTVLHAIVYSRCEDLAVDFLNSLFKIVDMSGISIMNVNCASDDIIKRYPLYYALIVEKYMISKFLVEHGARVNLSNAYGARYHTSAEYLLNNLEVEEVQGIVEVLRSRNFLGMKKSPQQQLEIFREAFRNNTKKYAAGKPYKKDPQDNKNIIHRILRAADSDGPQIEQVIDPVSDKGIVLVDGHILPEGAWLHFRKKEDSNELDVPGAQLKTTMNSCELNTENVACGISGSS